MITSDEFYERMNVIASGNDDYYHATEYGHIGMDNLMCEVLRQLGYEKGVEIFEKADKWYS